MSDEPIVVEISSSRGDRHYLALNPATWVAYDPGSGFPIAYFEYDEQGGSWISIHHMIPLFEAINVQLVAVVEEADPDIYERECKHVLPPRTNLDPFVAYDNASF